jgi:hypothetical protein
VSFAQQRSGFCLCLPLPCCCSAAAAQAGYTNNAGQDQGGYINQQQGGYINQQQGTFTYTADQLQQQQ